MTFKNAVIRIKAKMEEQPSANETYWGLSKALVIIEEEGKGTCENCSGMSDKILTQAIKYSELADKYINLREKVSNDYL